MRTQKTEIYKDGKLIESIESPILPPPTITPAQCRVMLHRLELLKEVEGLIAKDAELSIWWEYSLSIERENEHVLNLASKLKWESEQLDDFFIDASQI
jgi:hypothetical protein